MSGTAEVIDRSDVMEKLTGLVGSQVKVVIGRNTANWLGALRGGQGGDLFRVCVFSDPSEDLQYGEEGSVHFQPANVIDITGPDVDGLFVIRVCPE